MASRQLTKEERHPELFLPDKGIDRRREKRVIPMEVLNLSFPRTAVQAALNILGYPCYHSVLLFSNISDCELWNSALDAKFFNKGRKFTRTEWDQLLGSYGAVSADPPAVAFAEDLVDIYPDAKVVLVEREIESWYKSFSRTVMEELWGKAINLIASCDPFFVGPLRDTHMRWAKGWMQSRNKQEMQQKARQVYRDHYALVRRVTPKERLLEFKLSDGWEPLCKFLGKPVPDVPFPHVNDEDALHEMISIIAKRGLWNFIKRAIVWVVIPFIIAVLGYLYFSQKP